MPMIEKIFATSRFAVLVNVIACSIAAILLYIASVNIIVHTIIEFVTNIPSTSDGGKRLAVKLLKLLDIMLIAITFQIIAVGLYRLFISPANIKESKFLGALHITNFHDLKITLVQVAVVILIVLFLEQAVEVGATLETLYFGLGIGLVVFAAVYAWKRI